MKAQSARFSLRRRQLASPAHSFAVAFALGFVSPVSYGAAEEASVNAFGSGGGAPGALARHGLEVELAAIGDLAANVSGGARRHAVMLGTLDLQLTADLERGLAWQGAKILIDIIGNAGGNPSAAVGDAQGVDNIAAPSAVRLYEIWLQQQLFDCQLSILVGKYDLNSEFYVLDAAGLFLNSSFGIGPEFSGSGLQGPSIYPRTALGSRMAISPARGWVYRGAMLDAAPLGTAGDEGMSAPFGRGLLLVSELGWVASLVGPEEPSLALAERRRRVRVGRSANALPRAGKLALGGWYYTGRLEELQPVPDGPFSRRRGSRGAYLIAEADVYRSRNVPSRRGQLFLQLGVADERFNRFGDYAGAGAVLSGLVSGTSEHQVGLGVAVARDGDPYHAARTSSGATGTRSEIVLEATYRISFGSWLWLQPDVEYVIHPDTNPDRNNALAFLLRAEIAL
jgi:porin